MHAIFADIEINCVGAGEAFMAVMCQRDRQRVLLAERERGREGTYS
jgi:hypothetical protein